MLKNKKAQMQTILLILLAILILYIVGKERGWW